MSFLADNVMKFLGYRALRMFTYYHVSLSVWGCHGTPIYHLIYHNPPQIVIAFTALRHETLWALHHACCLAQFSKLCGTQQHFSKSQAACGQLMHIPQTSLLHEWIFTCLIATISCCAYDVLTCYADCQCPTPWFCTKVHVSIYCTKETISMNLTCCSFKNKFMGWASTSDHV
jgi:hypothetical protein